VKWRLGAIALSVAVLGLQRLSASEPPLDPALLEFLGSVDSEDKDWHDYLAHTDIDQVARRANRPRGSGPPNPAAASPGPSAPAPKDPPAPPGPVRAPPVVSP
jgi:hypothetical protein